ncbi:mpv17 2 [Octopus vulgaris]|uniref:Mpv17 2 n=3 Tax=Octopus TaxID=6643 RepID=A0AA36F2X7_OCTVU|nr:mpv17 2 [Octopus vulgaris]
MHDTVLHCETGSNTEIISGTTLCNKKENRKRHSRKKVETMTNVFIGARKRIYHKVVSGVQLLFSRKYLLLTNTAISITSAAGGDSVQQLYELSIQRQQTWNRDRTLHISITGLILGPPSHYWYHLIDYLFPGSSIRVVVKKLLFDQTIGTPIGVFLFLSSLGILENSSVDKMLTEYKNCGKTLLLSEWLIWPPIQAINFAFIPLKFRVLFDNSASFGFDIYYSYIKYRTDKVSD